MSSQYLAGLRRSRVERLSASEVSGTDVILSVSADGRRLSITSVSIRSFPSISVMLFSVIVVCCSLVDVVIFSLFSVVLLSVVHLSSNIFLFGAKSHMETVDSLPSTKRTRAYCRFFSINSSTRGSYLLDVAIVLDLVLLTRGYRVTTWRSSLV